MSIVLAFDGDSAGEHAINEAMLTAMGIFDTERDFLRAFCHDRKDFKDCVGFLSNIELVEELNFWRALTRPPYPTPDWWQDMCEEHSLDCQAEIMRRSRKTNDSIGGNSYIKAFNQNNPISAILESHGTKAAPGRMSYCPMHDDSTPSLSVSKDDGRAYCFNQSCELWNGGRGVDAYDLNKRLGE